MSSLYECLGEAEIRLLVVREQNEATGCLELHTYPRTAAPEYDAVSYTWGDDRSNTSVTCNGVLLDIRTNLFKALPFINDFRPEPRTRPLWIDAICLNQRDLQEKAIHVPRMNEVYENASRTLIWLGEAADNSDLAIDNMENLTRKLLSVTDASSLTVQQRITNYDLPPVNDEKWEAIKALQLRPWFFRLWTFQEIILSKEAVLMCGHKCISWDALIAIHEASFQASLHAIVEAKEDQKSSPGDARRAIHNVDFLRKREGKGQLALPMLLTLSADRGYSLPVDRVWALLGLLNRNYQQMILDARLVDYSDSAISKYYETFLGILKFHIKHDKAMAMQLIEDDMRTVCNPMLPSWCPDWHTNKGGIPLARWPEALAGIPGGEFRRIEPFMHVNSDSSLELCGLRVDVIDCVTESTGQDMLENESYPWLAECVRIINGTSFVPYAVYPSTAAIPAIPTTLVDGTPISEQRQKYMRAEEVLKYVLYPPGTLSESPRTILRCNDRKFFRTKASRLGIGPADLEENDILCAMYGARTLWALRPCKQREKSQVLDEAEPRLYGAEKQEFELLGTAYTPSLLNSQAWQGRSCESMERFTLR